MVEVSKEGFMDKKVSSDEKIKFKGIKFLSEPDQISYYYQRAKKHTLELRKKKFAFLIFSFIFLFFLILNYKEEKIDIFPSLAYEVEAVYQQGLESRFSLLNLSKNKILDFLREKEDSLNFSPFLLKDSLNQWKSEACDLLDYEEFKVFILVYHLKESEKRLFYFSFEGDLSLLLSGEIWKKNKKYKHYEQGGLNMLAWQSSERVVSVLAAYEELSFLLFHSKRSLSLWDWQSNVQE